MEYIKEFVMDRSSTKLVTDYGFISLMQTPHESLNDFPGIADDQSTYKTYLEWSIALFTAGKSQISFILEYKSLTCPDRIMAKSFRSKVLPYSDFILTIKDLIYTRA